MSVIDDYIAKAHSALSSGNDAEIDKTAREIVATFSSEIPHLSSYRGARIIGDGPNRHTADNLRQLVGKLKVLREAKDRELYGEYGLATLTEHIRLLEDAAIEGDERKLPPIFDRIDRVYAHYYKSYVDGLTSYGYAGPKSVIEQALLRVEKLKMFRDKELRDFKIAEASAASVTAQANSSSSAAVDVNVELSMTIEQIDALPDSSLSEDEKTILKGMIADLQDKDSKRRAGKLQKLLKWLSTKGVDVFIAAMPYIVQLIQSQM